MVNLQILVCHTFFAIKPIPRLLMKYSYNVTVKARWSLNKENWVRYSFPSNTCEIILAFQTVFSIACNLAFAKRTAVRSIFTNVLLISFLYILQLIQEPGILWPMWQLKMSLWVTTTRSLSMATKPWWWSLIKRADTLVSSQRDIQVCMV